jgi:calcium/calmodulin-dependent protein kinase I
MQNEKNMIHRDIKPYNIMLAEKNNLDSVKIIDFGLAVMYAPNGVSDYSRCGTVLYQAPEQQRKLYAYSKTQDPWAVGAITF